MHLARRNRSESLAAGEREGFSNAIADAPMRFRNQVLSALPASSLEQLSLHLHRVRLKPRQALAQAGLPQRAAYFIEAGAVCILSRRTPTETPIELGIVDWSGFVGLPILLSDGRHPYQCIVQIPGEAWRIEAEILREAYERDASLRRVLNCHIQARLVQQAQIGLCNSRHTVEQRICRWLLMAGDRVDGGSIPATHDLVARMLGARRAGITVALGELERSGVLRKSRGRIDLLDLTALNERACQCHRVVRLESERLFKALAIANARECPSSARPEDRPAGRFLAEQAL